MGVPVVSMDSVLQNVVENAGKTPEYNHSFFLKVRDMIKNNDQEALIKERVHIKLLRLCNQAQEGFILTDFPTNVGQAETLETFRGGLNSFVHVSLPESVIVDIEESKITCQDCGRVYYSEEVHDHEQGVHIEPFGPKQDHCGDCGSTSFFEGSDPVAFEKELEAYKTSKEELLAFYNNYVRILLYLYSQGLLVDFDLKRGFEDYADLKKQIQYNIKH